ncbi:MAG: ribose 5-phosphate isomerase B [Deltaproteobacteria bacterium]|nr:ribose 5-phosphate isomerase B [Deltaproteobacteria bacterium]
MSGEKTLATSLASSLAIASDHAGFPLKEYLKHALPDIDWKDLGPTGTDRVDYPDFAKKVAEAVAAGKAPAGVLVCGTGVGMSITANKIKGVRAAVVESECAARLSRRHNDANVLCLGARILAPEYAKEIVEAWLASEFEGGRHAERVQKIRELEASAHETHDTKFPNHPHHKPSKS